MGGISISPCGLELSSRESMKRKVSTALDGLWALGASRLRAEGRLSIRIQEQPMTEEKGVTRKECLIPWQ